MHQLIHSTYDVGRGLYDQLMFVDAGACMFRVLGPVQVEISGRLVSFSRRQQIDLLAYLLLHVDRVVAVEQIIDAMWGEAVPRTAQSQITNMVSQLRAALVCNGQPLASLQRQPAGYRIRLHLGGIDLGTFTSLAAQARQAQAPAEAVRLRRAALELWRGDDALAGVRASFAATARTHLAEQRNALREELFDAELSVGNHGGIVAELTDVVAANPSRERLVAQLMTSLYRDGRAADALAVFRRARATLVDDYGLEPSAALRDLERMILTGDGREPADRGERQPIVVRNEIAALAVPAQLPMDVRGFVGRRAELAALDSAIAGIAEPGTAVVCVLMGTAGVGKTTTAIHWAHRVSDRFPDGQLYLNLRGFDPHGPMTTAEAIRTLLDTFSVPPEKIPVGLDAQAALYRSLIVGRRLLVVLDNAVDSEQVTPLLPATSGSAAIITSRNHLTGLITTWGACPVTLEVLEEAEARQLFVARLGLRRVSAEEEAVERIVRQCARLPLALSLAAARAATRPGFTLKSLCLELAEARGGVTALVTDSSMVDVSSVFSWSYRRLTPAAATLFRLLGLHPGPDIGVAAAASLAGRDRQWATARLQELAHAHLIREHEPGRFTMHDLLRAYATARSETDDSETDRIAAIERILDHYLHSAYAAALVIYPHRAALALPPAPPGVIPLGFADRDSAQAWFATEHPVLLAAVERAANTGLSRHAWQLASALSTFLSRRGHGHDWVSVQRLAVDVTSRLDDRPGEAHARCGLGQAYNLLGDCEQAHLNFRRSLDLFQQFGDSIGQANIHLLIDTVYEKQADYPHALSHAEAALQLYRRAGHLAGEARSSNSAGWFYARLGRYDEAVAHCERAVALHREVGDRQGIAQALDSLGFVRHQLGQYSQAAADYQLALAELQAVGSLYHQTIPLLHLGETLTAAGQAGPARRAWLQALDILERLEHPDTEKVRERLSQLEHVG